MWNNSYEEVFDKVKSMVCKDTKLWYFDICKPVPVQVDAFQKGLGFALLHDSHSIAFASRDLTPVEQHSANIECELLACVSEQNSSTPVSLGMPSLFRVVKSLLNGSPSRTW